MADISRRTALLGACGFAALFAVGGAGAALAGDGGLLRPPGGQDEARFIGACLKCDKCRSICPENCITTCVVEDGLVNYRTPRIDYRKGQCTFCGECIGVCPTEALVAFDETREKVGLAVIDRDECIAFQKGGCRVCVDACVYDAISLDAANNPVVDAQLCNGCGRCEFACPSASYRAYSGSKNRGVNVRTLAAAGAAGGAGAGSAGGEVRS